MAKKKTAKKTAGDVVAIRHQDKRKNIPTEELRDFVAPEEHAPKTMLYPRDPSLDPQLVWKGKDEQDRADLAIPIVPVYIQEKVKPQAIIDALPRLATGDGQMTFWNDFNGGPDDFDKKVQFYEFDQNWQNRMILGDSLLVMTSLAEKEGLKGAVQTIYFDPPYGIEFGSNWQVSTRKRSVKDGRADDATRQPEQIRAFRDTWKLGIHSYLAYLRDRLQVSRDLLTETGSIFVQIGDENVHLVRSVLDEVFGPENFSGQIAFFKTASQSTIGIPSVVDYILVYARDLEHQKLRPILRLKQPGERGAKQYVSLISPDFKTVRRMTSSELDGSAEIPAGWKICALGPTTSQGYQEERSKPYYFEGKPFRPSADRHWSYDPDPGMEMDRLVQIGRIRRSGEGLRTVLLADDNPTTALDNVWMDTGTGSFTEDQIYVVQTGVKAIERCVLMSTDPGDLVLDPTCGSGTTAFAAESWGRRWITCDTSRVALSLARTRMMSAKFPYYYLADSPEGIEKEFEVTGRRPPSHETANDVRKGFVYRRAPHVTMKRIANNPDIRDGMTQEEIDIAIRRHTDTKFLFNDPYVDVNRVRVCGPFTVESLSPHRVLSTSDEDVDRTVTEHEGRKQQDFATMILENLAKAGVQNTQKNERLNFDSLEPYAGVWIQGAGGYTDADGTVRRVAISLGPEHGTVGPQQVKEAAKEAVQGVGFDLLLVCGFAFDPHVAEEAKRYGKLTVLPAKMNPDLAMGDDLLKKTGSGNLFMVFGEPDVDIRKQKDGQIVVEIRGVDVYDPTTGQIRSNTTSEIACWFIDDAYDGESFFVRQAYFTGEGDPYAKLKRALRAEIDEAAWSELYSTVSRPFPRPDTGKIAVKVINHYGDEVLKVFSVQ